MTWVQPVISRLEPIETGSHPVLEVEGPKGGNSQEVLRQSRPSRFRGRTVPPSMSRGWCRVEVALSDTSRSWFLLAVGTRGRGRNVQCRRPCNGARTSLCPAESERRSRVPGTSHHLQCNDIPRAPLLLGTLRPSTPC